MSTLDRPCQRQIVAVGQGAHRVSWLSLVLLVSGMLLGGWVLPRAWGQEMTGGMKLILEELRQVKRSHAEALAQIEELRQQLRALAAGGMAAASYRLPQKVEFTGVRVPLERRDIWERLDEEFLLYIGRPGQVMLWPSGILPVDIWKS